MRSCRQIDSNAMFFCMLPWNGAHPAKEGVETEGAGVWAERRPGGLSSVFEASYVEFGPFCEERGLRRKASTFDPCSFFVFRDQGQAVGAFTTHIDDILGCGEPDVLPKIRGFSEQRFGAMKLQENSSVHASVGLNQEANFSATLTQADFTKNLRPFRIMGGEAEITLAGRCEVTSVKAGGASLAGDGLATGYLCETGPNRIAYQLPSRCGCVSYQRLGENSQEMATGNSFEVSLVWQDGPGRLGPE